MIPAVAAADDVELGVLLLRGVPTNEHREPELLRHISDAAQAFGRSLAADGSLGAPDPQDVHERRGGLGSRTPALARYHPRSGRIELFVDVLAHCEQVVAERGWADDFPPGCLRAAALLHESAHAAIHHGRAAALRRALAVPALRFGPIVRWAHVAGAEELAAHAFAQSHLGLRRSPLLVTAAAMESLESTLHPSRPSLKED